MKTTFRFIIAAMAAIAVFSSCRKELVNESANKTTDGVRTISVLFDNSTKATLDGFTPKFEENDAIRVSNTEKSEERTISVDGSGNATFTTTLSGALTAIYPADAAVLASEATDAPIATSDNFKVLATQDGTVEKAIIASATVAEGENTATFNGLTALFEITPPSGATNITITSLNKIDATTGRRSTTAGAVAINTTGEDATAKCKITVSVSDGKAYVSLVPGVKLSDLSFEYTIDATHGAMKGIPTKDITAAGKTDATVANTKYTIGKTGWHLYVKIQMNSKIYKWATMNIGANNETELGQYFAWGDVVGQTWIPLTGGVAAHWSGSGFTTAPTLDPANPSVLPLSYDAANANWGGSWHMPTQEEFDALCALSNKSWQTDYNGSGVKGYEFKDADGNSIFLPVAGWGCDTDLNDAGDYGNYWSSSLYTGNPIRAYYLNFSAGGAGTEMDNFRSYGNSVRALSE